MVLRDADKVRPGDRLETRLRHGRATSRVERVERDEETGLAQRKPIGFAGDIVGLRWSLGVVAALLVLSTLYSMAVHLPRAKQADAEKAHAPAQVTAAV